MQLAFHSATTMTADLETDIAVTARRRSGTRTLSCDGRYLPIYLPFPCNKPFLAFTIFLSFP